MVFLVSGKVLRTPEVNDRDIVIDHALKIRPPVDGFLLQAGRGICGVSLVDIKQAVVVPAVELVVPGVIVGNVDRGQVNDIILRLAFERDVLISLRGVAVAVNHKVDGDQLFFALDIERNGLIDSPLALYILQRKGLGGVTGQGVLAKVGVILLYIFVSSDGNAAEVAVGLVAGNIADGVCSLDQCKGCRGVRCGLRGAGHLYRLFELGQLFLAGDYGRNDLRITLDVERNGSTALHEPCIILVFQRNSRGAVLGIVGFVGIGIELFHILLSVNGDRVSVAALSITLNLTGGVGAGNQRVALALGSVGRLVIGAVDGDLADQTAEVVLTGSGGLIGLGGSVLFPHGIQRGGSGHNDAAAGLIRCGRCIPVGTPSEEGMVLAGRRLRSDGESMRLLILRGRLVGLAGWCAGAAVGVIVQRKSQQNGRAFEIVICGVLAVGKQGTCALATFVAAASGPDDVVDFVVVNTCPDILCIGKTESIVVDIILAEVNGDIIAADARNGMSVNLVADLDLDARHGRADGRMQHNGTVSRRQCVYRQQAENHDKRQQCCKKAFLHTFLLILKFYLYQKRQAAEFSMIAS